MSWGCKTLMSFIFSGGSLRIPFNVLQRSQRTTYRDVQSFSRIRTSNTWWISAMIFTLASVAWAHRGQIFTDWSQVILRLSQTCQSKTNCVAPFLINSFPWLKWLCMFPFIFSIVNSHCLIFFLLACCWKMWLLGWRTGNRSAKGNWANWGLWDWGSLHSSI